MISNEKQPLSTGKVTCLQKEGDIFKKESFKEEIVNIEVKLNVSILWKWNVQVNFKTYFKFIWIFLTFLFYLENIKIFLEKKILIKLLWYVK